MKLRLRVSLFVLPFVLLLATFWFVLLLGSSASNALADPTGSHGLWIDPPGYIGQCFVCPDGQTSDCMDAEPIYLEIDHARHLHITQLYPIAWSEETGLLYKGKLTLNVSSQRSDEVLATVTFHWLREDGFAVNAIQQYRLRYYLDDSGNPEAEMLHEHVSFTCR